MNPLTEIDNVSFAPVVKLAALSIMVVPSHSLTNIPATPALSRTQTVPDANHVPAVPCETDGPVK